jgi:hypothetical protein
MIIRIYKTLMNMAAVLSITLLFISCYPGDSVSVTDTDTVTTFRQQEADFSTKLTYAMPDSVIFVDGDGNPVSGDHEFDTVILAAIDRNMSAAGYNKVNEPAQADVHVLPFSTTTQWVGGGCYPSWWCGWWYCYPGWCYPVTYTYSTGTILMAMLDPADSGGSTEANALWLGGINGLLSSGVDSRARIDRDIDQAFKQSPYLADGK